MGGSRLPSLVANSGWLGPAALASVSALRRNPGPLMPEPSPLCEREFLPSANQALADLEAATGKPVMVMEAPELGVLATIRRAGPQEASHLLRIKSGGNRLADYLIVFECRMALRDGPPGPQPVVKARRQVREQVIRECERLQQQLPLAKARELGNFLYDGLILQLRSMGPGIGVDRWIREHCPDLRDPQQQAMEAEISNNLGALESIRTKLDQHTKLHNIALSTLQKLQQPPETITVLLLAANPLDQAELRLDEEVRSIGEMIRKAEHRDAVRLVSRWAVRPLDVFQAINECRPAIVHFSGHGSNQNELIFQDNSGNSKPVTKEAIVQMLAAASDDIQLVFFNACYSRGQAKAVVTHIPAAIGMNAAIGDDAARVFAAQFYSAIGFGHSISRAFQQARAALMLEGIPEENTPELFVAPGIAVIPSIIVKPLHKQLREFDGQLIRKELWSNKRALPTALEDRALRFKLQKDIIDSENSIRSTIAQGFGGLLLFCTAYISWKTLRATNEKQVSERFSKAVEQLGNKNIHIRLGGIYSLEQIAKDSEEIYYRQVIETLTSYLRERAPYVPLLTETRGISETTNETDGVDEIAKLLRNVPDLRTDIQAVISVLGRRRFSYGNGEEFRMDFRAVDLTQLEFPAGSNFNGSDFTGSNLKRSILSGVSFASVQFNHAVLEGVTAIETAFDHSSMGSAKLSYARLRGSSFKCVKLNGADLTKARAEKTDFSEADMSNAKLVKALLTGANLRDAIFTETDLSFADLAHFMYLGCQDSD